MYLDLLVSKYMQHYLFTYPAGNQIIVFCRKMRHDNKEFVFPPMNQNIFFTQYFFKQSGCLLDDDISHLNAIELVNMPEIIDVDDKKRNTVKVAARTVNLLGNPVFKIAPIIASG